MKGERFATMESGVQEALGEVFKHLREDAPSLYAPGATCKSDFFRDIAGSRYHTQAEEVARAAGLPYELLLNVYDKSIIEVENRPPAGELSEKFRRALARVLAVDSVVRTGSTDVPQTTSTRSRSISRKPIWSAPATGASHCPSPRITSALRSCATASAPT